MELAPPQVWPRLALLVRNKKREKECKGKKDGRWNLARVSPRKGKDEGGDKKKRSDIMLFVICSVLFVVLFQRARDKETERERERERERRAGRKARERIQKTMK